MQARQHATDWASVVTQMINSPLGLSERSLELVRRVPCACQKSTLGLPDVFFGLLEGSLGLSETSFGFVRRFSRPCQHSSLRLSEHDD